MKLYDLAHARSGDKGTCADITVIARRPADFPLLRDQVTADRVRAHLAGTVRGTVRRYEVAGLGALKFVLEDALDGGVTRSLAVDAHGKALAMCLLEMDMADGASDGQPTEPTPARHRL
ncbi:hypothetical protein [Streptomyces sp. VNUA24]|uniref:AtuA-related protein n=1 Tax=Streptomyces sp. VNUA24 TaxID=3031131 RepID=UPI0023B78224|nr:hypothetical protein [Streptomyces sp. VNUA24]WEH12983.1 hypothetical protein PYR72_04385 [Streptomyces sp. VNUA24]